MAAGGGGGGGPSGPGGGQCRCFRSKEEKRIVTTRWGGGVCLRKQFRGVKYPGIWGIKTALGIAGVCF